MRVVWAILCQSSVQDKDTNNISLLNIVEELQIAAVPPGSSSSGAELVVSNVFELVVLTARTDFEVGERGRGRVRAYTPDGIATAPQEFEIDLSTFLRHRMRLKIPGFPVTGEGIYKILVDCRSEGKEDWTEAFELPVRITLPKMDSG